MCEGQDFRLLDCKVGFAHEVPTNSAMSKQSCGRRKQRHDTIQSMRTNGKRSAFPVTTNAKASFATVALVAVWFGSSIFFNDCWVGIGCTEAFVAEVSLPSSLPLSSKTTRSPTVIHNLQTNDLWLTRRHVRQMPSVSSQVVTYHQNTKSNQSIREATGGIFYRYSNKSSESNKSIDITGRFARIVVKLRSILLATQRLRYNILRFWQKRNKWKIIHKAFTTIALCCWLIFGGLAVPIDSSWAAGSSGRMGGSIKPSITRTYSRPTSSGPSRSLSSPSSSRSRPRPPIRVMPPPLSSNTYHRHHYRPQNNHRFEEEVQTTTITKADGTTTLVRKQTRSHSLSSPIHRYNNGQGNAISPSSMALVVGTSAAVAYAVGKHSNNNGNGYDDGVDTPLGPGASVISLTLCFLVPDRTSSSSKTVDHDNNTSSSSSDKNDVLSSMERIASTADTSTRKGLQRLVEDTCLSVLRQQDAIVSIGSQFQHVQTATEAERCFRRSSTNHRMKFDDEAFSNVDGQTTSTAVGASTDGSSNTTDNETKIPLRSTVALVHITVAIEGNSLTKLFYGGNGQGSIDGDSDGLRRQKQTHAPSMANNKITTRKALVNTLTQLSSDAQIDDCLLSTEVIWAPQNNDEQLTMEDVYADFPTLYTLLD